MVGEVIANYEQYIWTALGLFVVGILTIITYDNSSAASRPKRRKLQQSEHTQSD